MDMQTTIGMSESKTLAEQLRGEILDRLARGVPLTSRELYDRCESAEAIAAITVQLAFMQKSGQVEKAGLREPSVVSKGSRAVPTYRLASAALAPEQTEKLAAVIESTLETVTYPLSAITGESHDGDEFAHPIFAPLPELAGDFAPEDVPAPSEDAPILAAIAELRPGRVSFDARDPERLVALADALSIFAPLVSAWLRRMAIDVEVAA